MRGLLLVLYGATAQLVLYDMFKLALVIHVLFI